MKLKVDENLPSEIVDFLHRLGHEPDTVVDEGMAGASDGALMSQVRREERALVTLDKGIADIRAYPPEEFPGIVLFRPPTLGRGVVLEFVRRHLPAVLALDLAGRLLVVTERSIRLR